MFARYWKAIIAFVVPLLALLTAVGTSPEIQAAAPGPAAWIAAVAIPAVAGVLTFLKRNLQTAEDLDAAAARLGLKLVPIGTVVPPVDLP